MLAYLLTGHSTADMASLRHETARKLDSTPAPTGKRPKKPTYLGDVPNEIMFNIFSQLDPESQAKMVQTSPLYNSIGHMKQDADNTKRDTLIEQLQGRLPQDQPDGQPTLKQLLYHIQTRAKPLPVNQQQQANTIALISKLMHAIETSPYTDEEALKLVLRAVYTKPDECVEGLDTFTPSLSVHSAYLHWMGPLVYSKDLRANTQIIVHVQVSDTENRHIGRFTVKNHKSLFNHKGWEHQPETANLAKALRAADIENVLCARWAITYVLWAALTKLPDFVPEGRQVAVYDSCS